MRCLFDFVGARGNVSISPTVVDMAFFLIIGPKIPAHNRILSMLPKPVAFAFKSHHARARELTDKRLIWWLSVAAVPLESNADELVFDISDGNGSKRIFTFDACAYVCHRGQCNGMAPINNKSE